MPGVLRPVGIVATGAYVPDHIMTNKDLEKMIDTTDEWIREKTGISARRIIDPEDTTSDLAARAAMQCLDEAGVDPMEVELMIVATSSPDHIQPPTACVTQGKIGAMNAGAFDINTVCSGFNHAIAAGAGFIADGSHETVLVVGARHAAQVSPAKWSPSTLSISVRIERLLIGHHLRESRHPHRPTLQAERARDPVPRLDGPQRLHPRRLARS